MPCYGKTQGLSGVGTYIMHFFPMTAAKKWKITAFKHHSSDTAWRNKAKFHVEPPWEGGTKVYINGQGHMTNGRHAHI